MFKSESEKLNFSQRNGFEPVPEQLKLGQVSDQFRNLVDCGLKNKLLRLSVYIPYRNSSRFTDKGIKLTMDFHVKFFGNSFNSYDDQIVCWRNEFERSALNDPFNKLFDMIEFFMAHPESDAELKSDLSQAFVDARTAYRLKDDRIIAIGNHEEAQAVLRAIDDTEQVGHSSPRQYLIDAGKKLTNGDWKGSVRDSIHSVEAMALIIAPQKGKNNLTTALKKLERERNVNSGLKTAFGNLYGYTSDPETGVRHADPYWNSDAVDEADALFMLGACASFVSYLIAKNT